MYKLIQQIEEHMLEIKRQVRTKTKQCGGCDKSNERLASLQTDWVSVVVASSQAVMSRKE